MKEIISHVKPDQDWRRWTILALGLLVLTLSIVDIASGGHHHAEPHSHSAHSHEVH